MNYMINVEKQIEEYKNWLKKNWKKGQVLYTVESEEGFQGMLVSDCEDSDKT